MQIVWWFKYVRGLSFFFLLIHIYIYQNFGIWLYNKFHVFYCTNI